MVYQIELQREKDNKCRIKWMTIATSCDNYFTGHTMD